MICQIIGSVLIGIVTAACGLYVFDKNIRRAVLAWAFIFVGNGVLAVLVQLFKLP